MSGGSVSLDTSVAIAVLSGQASDLLSRSIEQFLLPVPGVVELRYGAMNSRRVAENSTSGERLVTNCQVLNITVEMATVYASLRLSLKEQGTPTRQRAGEARAACGHEAVWPASAACGEWAAPLHPRHARHGRNDRRAGGRWAHDGGDSPRVLRVPYYLEAADIGEALSYAASAYAVRRLKFR